MDFRRRTLKTMPSKPTVPAAPVATIARAGAVAQKAAPRTRAVSREERERMIREEAYLTAERDHFRGDPRKYWLEAESRIDRTLRTLH